jgi:hypothetical protein
MPRVNRDLQRRMAARRERERRRPSGDRRYQFATPESALDADEALSEAETADAGQLAEAPPPAARDRARTQTATASSKGVSRTAARPFSAYKEEYAYVYGDLRRVGMVIGSLLVVLIVLYFALPVLVH